jgi:hypothetical protein
MFNIVISAFWRQLLRAATIHLSIGSLSLRRRSMSFDHFLRRFETGLKYWPNFPPILPTSYLFSDSRFCFHILPTRELVFYWFRDLVSPNFFSEYSELAIIIWRTHFFYALIALFWAPKPFVHESSRPTSEAHGHGTGNSRARAWWKSEQNETWIKHALEREILVVCQKRRVTWLSHVHLRALWKGSWQTANILAKN